MGLGGSRLQAMAMVRRRIVKAEIMGIGRDGGALAGTDPSQSNTHDQAATRNHQHLSWMFRPATAIVSKPSILRPSSQTGLLNPGWELLGAQSGPEMAIHLSSRE